MLGCIRSFLAKRGTSDAREDASIYWELPAKHETAATTVARALEAAPLSAMSSHTGLGAGPNPFSQCDSRSVLPSVDDRSRGRYDGNGESSSSMGSL
jgi:hypothetical protein